MILVMVLRTSTLKKPDSIFAYFQVEGIGAEEVVEKSYAKKIIASASPYKVSYDRLTPGMLNNECEAQLV